jgi:hypothetical protein
MPLAITRVKKLGGVWVAADGVPANTTLSKFTVINKMEAVTTPVPGDSHISVAIGPEAKAYTIEFPWNMNEAPCVGQTYVESLKRWTCNSVYAATPTGSLVDDMQVGYYLAKTITTTREKTGMAGAVARWMVSLNLVKLRDQDVIDCPDFQDEVQHNPATSTATEPMFKMTNARTGEVLTTKLTKVTVKHNGSVQSFPLYDEEAITILPPLGNVGPQIDIEFRVKSRAEFNTISMWGATRTLIVGVDQVGYPEFDIDNPPTYYSKWIGSGISSVRAVASGAGYASGFTERMVSMSLLRYWSYQIIEV